MIAADQTKKQSALFIAYHFPPLQGSTGTTRTLAFARYLRDWNWHVRVLTVTPDLYPQIKEANYADIPDYVGVIRANALDSQKHLSIRGRYSLLLATPDRWQSWIITGFFAGLKAIRKHRPNVIISTYPIASAHCIGYLLSKFTGIPWIADFRDPMAQPNYPPQRVVHWSYRKIETIVFRRAARVITTAPGTTEIYRERFPHYPAHQIITVPNGFDPEMFAGIDANAVAARGAQDGPCVLLHSGLLYPEERDPTQLFAAIHELQNEGKLTAKAVQIHFRAPGNEANYQTTLERLGITTIVKLLPSVPYQEALKEMFTADGLLILQTSNCNQQIPAKIYEYLYCERAILGLTDPVGDTAQLLKQLGVPYLARLDSKDEIKVALLEFVAALQSNSAFKVPRAQTLKFSRRERTAELAKILNEVVSERA
jgi:glycosyltransferase involved in cell wall biosynthesis